MAEITTADLLKKIDDLNVKKGRLEIQAEALLRENATLKAAAMPPDDPPKPNRAARRAKKEK